MSFWCLQISQKTNKNFSRISALASKNRSNQKNKGTLYVPLIDDIVLTLLHYFLEASAEILTKILLVFLVEMKTKKGHFEIN